MKKIFVIFFLFLLGEKFSPLQAQSTIVDTTTLRNKINTDILPNTTGAITAYKMNNLLNGMLNVMQRYKADSVWISASHLYYKKYNTTYDLGTIASGNEYLQPNYGLLGDPYNGTTAVGWTADTTSPDGLVTKHELSVITNAGAIDFIVKYRSNAPVGGDAVGEKYLIGSSPTGAFASHPNEVAEKIGSSTYGNFTTATNGQQLIVDNGVTGTYETWEFDGTNWNQSNILVRVNLNTLSASMPIGTADSNDVIIKTNGIDALRIGADKKLYAKKFIGASSHNLLAVTDTITGEIGPVISKPLAAGTGITIDDSGDTTFITSSGISGVASVTGNIVDNTDPANPVVTGINQTTLDDTASAIRADIPIEKPQNGFIVKPKVAWLHNYVYNVSAGTYIIDGITYNSASTDITLDASDPSLDRIDVFAVNTSSAAVAITGTPASPPVEPSIDAATQLEVSFATVNAGTTEPTITNNWIYLENTEWTTSASAGTINPASTNNPYAGTKDVEGSSVANGTYISFTPSSAPSMGLYQNLIFEIRSKANWSTTKHFIIRFYNGTTAIGNPVNFGQSSYGFSSTNTTTYQTITIPLTDFGSISTATALRITQSNSSGTIGWYLDNIQLQSDNGGGVPSTITLTNDVNGSGTNTIAATVIGIRNKNIPSLSAGKLNYTGSAWTFDNTSYLSISDTAAMLAHYLRSSDAAATYVSLTGSYANPSWITSLAWSKITGTPTTISGYGITDFNSTFDTRFATKMLTPTAVKTSTYSAVVNDLVPVDASGGSVTVNLPNAPADKSWIVVKMIATSSSNTTTIGAAGSDVFNKTSGSTSLILSRTNQAVWLQYKASGAIWYVLADDIPLSTLNLSGGSTSQVLTKNSNTDYDYSWATPSAGSSTLASLSDVSLTSLAADDFLKYNGGSWINRTPANVRSDLGLGSFALLNNPATTNKDLIYYDGSAYQRLGIGSDGQILGVVGGTPTWSTLGVTDTLAHTIYAKTDQTVVPKLSLVDSNAATSGVQQPSPALYFTGQGWKSGAPTGSHPVDFRIYDWTTSQTAGPTGALWFETRRDAGSWDGLMVLNNAVSSNYGVDILSTNMRIRSSTLDFTNSGNSAAYFRIAAGNTTDLMPINQNAYLSFGSGQGTNGLNTGTQRWFQFKTSYNQVTAPNDAINYDLVINRTAETALSSGIQRLFSAQLASTEYFGVDNKGQVWQQGTITAGGTTGAQTINKPIGSVNFAIGATSLVVTNSLVTTSSLIFCQVMSNDATATSTQVVAGSGSFTIYLNAAATAETKVAFEVMGKD